MEGDHIGPFNLGNPGEFTMLELAEVSEEKTKQKKTKNQLRAVPTVLFLPFFFTIYNICAGCEGDGRSERDDWIQAKHGRRPPQEEAGHQQGQRAAEMGAQGLAERRAAPHGLGLQ